MGSVATLILRKVASLPAGMGAAWEDVSCGGHEAVREDCGRRAGACLTACLCAWVRAGLLMLNLSR